MCVLTHINKYLHKHTHTHLVAVSDAIFGHPASRTGCGGVWFWLWLWRLTQVFSANGAGLEDGAVLHLPLAQGFRRANHSATTVMV